MRVQDILDQKANPVIYTVAPERSVLEAVTTMVERNVGALLVVQDDALVGIITERDYLRLVAQKGRTPRNTPVYQIMARSVIYLTPDATLDEAMNIMTETRIRHLPVLVDKRILGVLSIGDLVKAKAESHEMHIRTLEAYIADDYPGPTASAEG